MRTAEQLVGPSGVKDASPPLCFILESLSSMRDRYEAENHGFDVEMAKGTPENVGHEKCFPGY